MPASGSALSATLELRTEQGSHLVTALEELLVPGEGFEPSSCEAAVAPKATAFTGFATRGQ